MPSARVSSCSVLKVVSIDWDAKFLDVCTPHCSERDWLEDDEEVAVALEEVEFEPPLTAAQASDALVGTVTP